MLFHYMFFIGSIGGFFLELFYRRIVLKKWVKPGIFKGYYLPLYGIGLVICYMYYIININFILKAILVMVSFTGIELICGLIFIKKLKINLWDYSNNFLNYKGLICLKFSLYWLILAFISFFVFNNVNIKTSNVMNLVILILEIIMTVDIVMFFKKKLKIKNNKNLK